MPQPLNRVTENPGTLEINNVGTRTLAQRPQLAIMAMECIAAWSHVESFFLDMYVAMAGGAAADTAAVYLALEGSSAKSAAVNALAERKLSSDNLALFRAILKVSKSGQKERDKLAHWVWGTASALPNALLLCDPRNMSFEPCDIYVYTENDFDGMRIRFENLAGYGFKFRWIFSEHPANRDGKIYDELCRESEIAEILSRQARQD